MPEFQTMTCAEFAQAIRYLGTNVRASRHLFGVNDRTVRRWASGECPIPNNAAALIRIMVRLGIKLPDAEKVNPHSVLRAGELRDEERP